MQVQLQRRLLHPFENSRGQHLLLRRSEVHLLRQLPAQISVFGFFENEKRRPRGFLRGRLTFERQTIVESLRETMMSYGLKLARDDDVLRLKSCA